MEALVNLRYGSPDVLQVTEVAQPRPKANEVLVEVIAAAVNPLDWHLLRGAPFLARLNAGLLRPRHTILGADIAGRVAAVGAAVTRFQPGAAVFGDAWKSGLGGFARYAAVREDLLVAQPANLSAAQAAATPLAALTALQGLRDTGKITAGQRVLINGASGGVGTFAVQLAHWFGAEVTGVCSTRNLELVRSLGAAQAIDYTREDWLAADQRYDLIFDLIANHTVSEYQRILAPSGRVVLAGFSTMRHMLQFNLQGAWASRRSSQQIGMMPTATPNQADLEFMRARLAAGDVVPVIDRTYPLAQAAEAIRYLETGRARGKVIIALE